MKNVLECDCMKGICANINSEAGLARLASSESHVLFTSQVSAPFPSTPRENLSCKAHKAYVRTGSERTGLGRQ